MKSFLLSKLAFADLEAIAVYTEQQWSTDQRNHYITGLDQAFKLLVAEPESGK